MGEIGKSLGELVESVDGAPREREGVADLEEELGGSSGGEGTGTVAMDSREELGMEAGIRGVLQLEEHGAHLAKLGLVDGGRLGCREAGLRRVGDQAA